MSIWRKMILQHLSRLEQGEMIVQEGQRHYVFGQPSTHLDIDPVELKIHDPNFYRRMILSGDKGVALSFMQGGWSTNDLAGLMRLYLHNLPAFQYLNYRWRRLGSLLKKLSWHSIRKSKQHILHHYDLSNDFFALWLDDSMMYSCAIFPNTNATLAQASNYKLQRICDKLALTNQDHLLEIGTGWGGMALYAAQHYGCRVTTTTISDRQYQYVTQKVAQLGLTHQVTVLNQDYRKLRGQFDKLVSIEMIEAIGYRYFKTFMRQCDQLLKPNGLALVQTITIADQVFDFYKHGNDFIRQFIFPGGCLPSIQTLNHSAAHATQLQLIHLEDIGAHYVLTLQRWLAHFNQNRAQIKSLGFDNAFLRMWEYYFNYCIAGFKERYISNAQLLWRKQSLKMLG